MTELRLLLRRSQEWLYPLVFFLMVIVLLPFAITTEAVQLKNAIPGYVWIITLLAAMLAVENIFSAEIEEGHIEQWLISTFPLPLLILIKLIAQWMMLFIPLLGFIPLISLCFHLTTVVMWSLMLTLGIGSPILIFLGSLGTALTLGLGQSGVFLGLLILPLVTPVLIFGVNIIQQSAQHLSILGPLLFLSGLSLLSVTLLPLCIAAALRVGYE